MGKPHKDLVGIKFFRYLVIKEAERNKHNQICWECLCDCGSVRIVVGGDLKSGRSKSCGCWQKEQQRKAVTTHGLSTLKHKYIPELQCYHAAKNRCTNPNHARWHDYGGRGIKFKFKSFDEFIAEVGFKSNSKLSLDRIDNDGDYVKGNVRWATYSQQNYNSRGCKET